MADEPLAFIARQADAQPIVHNRRGNLVLHRQKVAFLAIVGTRPQLPATGDVDEPRHDPQARILSFERSSQHCVNAEPSAGCLWVGRRAFEAEHRAQRADAERTQFRDLLNQAFSNAVAQVLEVLIASCIGEWQHRERSRGWFTHEQLPPRHTGTGDNQRAGAQPQGTTTIDCQRHHAGRVRGARGVNRRARRQNGNCRLHSVERGAYIRSRCRAATRVLDQAPGDCRPQLGPDVNRHGHRLVAEDRRAHFERCVPLERARASRHLVKHDAEGPDVAGHVHGLAAQLLGRHVRQRTDRDSSLRQRGMHLRHGGCHLRIDGALRQTEIEHLHAAIRCNDDVVAFQIPMDDAALVRVGQRIGQLTPVVRDLLVWQRAGVQQRAERASLDQLHRNVRLAVGFADFVDGADVRVVERCCRTRFTHQSGARRGIIEAGRGKHLDGDVAIQLLVAGAIHLPHATSPEPADDAIVR